MTPKQLYFGLLGLLGLLIVAAGGGFIWGQKQLDTKIATIRQLSGDIALESGQIQRLQKLQDDYQQILPLATSVQNILPSQKQQSEVIAQISTIVASSNLPLNGLTFEQTKGLPDDKSQTQAAKIAGILTMPVRFQSAGTYQQLQSLLQSFERQQRYMRVSTLEVKRAEGNKLAFNVTLEVFLKP